MNKGYIIKKYHLMQKSIIQANHGHNLHKIIRQSEDT